MSWLTWIKFDWSRWIIPGNCVGEYGRRVAVQAGLPRVGLGEKGGVLKFLFNVGLYGDRTYTRPGGLARGRA